MGCAVAVGFHCLLRSGEAFDVHAKDICLDPSASHGVLYLGLTKSGQRRGAAEAVTIDCCLVARLLAVWKTTSLPGDRLVPSPGKFRKIFNDMLAGLGIKDVGYKPYSLRRGGASFD